KMSDQYRSGSPRPPNSVETCGAKMPSSLAFSRSLFSVSELKVQPGRGSASMTVLQMKSRIFIRSASTELALYVSDVKEVVIESLSFSSGFHRRLINLHRRSRYVQ